MVNNFTNYKNKKVYRLERIFVRWRLAPSEVHSYLIRVEEIVSPYRNIRKRRI